MSYVQSPERQPSFVRALFSSIAERYDLANHLLSGGLDFFWRRRAAKIVKAWRPSRILDLATGSGDLALSLRAACPQVLIVGADFCHPMLRIARGKGLRNMASWPGALAEMRRVLRPGGHVLILDFSVPPPPLVWLYRPYLHHVLPRIAGLLTRQKAAYDYLGDSIEQFPHGAAMCRLLADAGLERAVFEPLSGGIVTLYTAGRARVSAQ
jgi:demethylmenaquinone methyltransferase/2-methoxy-6-polyprenyl-1,4-benzoquinol methylase